MITSVSLFNNLQNSLYFNDKLSLDIPEYYWHQKYINSYLPDFQERPSLPIIAASNLPSFRDASLALYSATTSFSTKFSNSDLMPDTACRPDRLNFIMLFS